MQITLIRHGKSLHTQNLPVTSSAFKKWIDKYNERGVVEECEYPAETIELINNAKLVLTSDFLRAVETAHYLAPHKKTIPLSLFREAELPILPLKGLKLAPNKWAFFLRIMWLMGYANDVESIGDARKRARQATDILIKYAREYQQIALVGHGIFNQFIAKELRERDWKGNKRTDSKHWYCTTYTL